MKVSMTTATARGGDEQSLEVVLKAVIADKYHCQPLQNLPQDQFHPLTQPQAHHLPQLEPAEATALFQDSHDSLPF